MKKTKYTFIGVIAFLLASNFVQCDRNSRAEDQLNIIKAERDTLRITIDERTKRYTAEITALAANNTRVLNKINATDSLLLELREKATASTKTSVIHTKTTEYIDTGSVQIVYRDSTVKEFIRWPISAIKNDPYFAGRVDIWPDTSRWKVLLRDTTYFDLQQKRTGFIGLGPAEYKITATNYNPYTKTTGLRAFTIKPKIRRWHLGINTGYGLVSNGIGDVKTGFYFGAGINYSFISF